MQFTLYVILLSTLVSFSLQPMFKNRKNKSENKKINAILEEWRALFPDEDTKRKKSVTELIDLYPIAYASDQQKEQTKKELIKRYLHNK